MATIPPGGEYKSSATAKSETDDSVVRRQALDDAPEQLRLLDDTHGRDILTALATGPRGGRELAEACDISRATAYRRLNRLEAAGFVTTELRPDPDGHHRKEFHLVRDRLTVVIEDDSIAVTAYKTGQ